MHRILSLNYLSSKFKLIARSFPRVHPLNFELRGFGIGKFFGSLHVHEQIWGASILWDVRFFIRISPLRMTGIRTGNPPDYCRHPLKNEIRRVYFLSARLKNLSEGSIFCGLLWRKNSNLLIPNPAILRGVRIKSRTSIPYHAWYVKDVNGCKIQAPHVITLGSF